MPPLCLPRCSLLLRAAASQSRRRLLSSLVQASDLSAEGVSTLTLKSPPANALTAEFAAELNRSILQAERAGARGLVLRSGLNGIFCAGFDLAELHTNSRERLAQFYTEVQELFLNLFGTDLPVVGQIGGHCLAGGMAISLSCDWRLMASNPKLLTGLNETQFGVAPPVWLTELFRYVAGSRAVEHLVVPGRLVSPQTALSVGLVDELYDTEEQLVSRTEAALQRQLSVSHTARAQVKQMLRSQLIDKLESCKREDCEFFCDYVLDSRVQAELEKYLQALKQRRSK